MPKKFECTMSNQMLDYYYNKCHYTIKQLCKIVGCKSDITMAKILKERGFDTNSNQKLAFQKRGGRSDDEFKEFLIKEYVENKRSMTSIAKELNITWVVVSRYLDKYQIQKRTKSEQQKGAGGSNWKGGRRKTSSGYIEIYMPNHPNANVRGCIYEHDYAIEQSILHRPLNENEVVHHKNRIKDDNRLCNLQLLTKQEHTRLHQKDMVNARNRNKEEVVDG